MLSAAQKTYLLDVLGIEGWMNSTKSSTRSGSAVAIAYSRDWTSEEKELVGKIMLAAKFNQWTELSIASTNFQNAPAVVVFFGTEDWRKVDLNITESQAFGSVVTWHEKKILLTHSLQEMLDPKSGQETKKMVWQHMKLLMREMSQA